VEGGEAAAGWLSLRCGAAAAGWLLLRCAWVAAAWSYVDCTTAACSADMASSQPAEVAHSRGVLPACNPTTTAARVNGALRGVGLGGEQGAGSRWRSKHYHTLTVRAPLGSRVPILGGAQAPVATPPK
jgi:hypothetical protein